MTVASRRDSISSTGAAPARRRPPPWWAIPLAVYAAARIVSGVMLAWAARGQPELTDDPGWHVEGTRPASPSYWEVLANWDGQWFKTIALYGYPEVDVSASTDQTALPFPPGYPALVRALMWVTGRSFEVVGATTSLVLGAVAVLILHRWLTRTRGVVAATSAVAVLSFFPSAPILQADYSESTAMVLLVLALRAAVERRWSLLLGVAFLLTFTRPIVLPLAAFVVLLELRRLVNTPRGERRPDWRAVGAAAGLGIISLGWPVTVSLMTGRLTGYTDVLAAWSRDGKAAESWVVGVWSQGHPALAVVIVLLIAGLAVVRWHHRTDPLPDDRIGTWAAVYLLFMLVATPIGTGVFRHALLTLVPLAPLVTSPGPGAPTRRRLWVVLAVVAVELALQYVWITEIFVVHLDRIPGVLP